MESRITISWSHGSWKLCANCRHAQDNPEAPRFTQPWAYCTPLKAYDVMTSWTDALEYPIWLHQQSPDSCQRKLSRKNAMHTPASRQKTPSKNWTEPTPHHTVRSLVIRIHTVPARKVVFEFNCHARSTQRPHTSKQPSHRSPTDTGSLRFGDSTQTHSTITYSINCCTTIPVLPRQPPFVTAATAAGWPAPMGRSPPPS